MCELEGKRRPLTKNWEEQQSPKKTVKNDDGVTMEKQKKGK